MLRIETKYNHTLTEEYMTNEKKSIETKLKEHAEYDLVIVEGVFFLFIAERFSSWRI